MKKLLIQILLVMILASCSNHDDNFELRIIFHKPDLQKAFISELDLNGIEYRIDSDGWVWYKDEYYADIQRIEHKVINDLYPANHYWNPIEVVHEYFIQRLVAANIPFETKEFKGKPHIVWEKDHEEEVDLILKEVLEYQANLQVQEAL